MDHKHDMGDQPSQTLAKGLIVLEAIATEQSPRGVRELARELDLSPAVVARLVSTLHNMGYLHRDATTQRYSLGAMVMKLGNAYAKHNPLPTLAWRVFEKYSERFEYNFYLGTLKRYQVIYLAVLDGRGPIKVVVEPGAFIGLHTTAIGKVLLASQSDDYIREFVQTDYFRPSTDNSVSDDASLWEEIDKVRSHGIACNDGEHFEDVAAIGAPIHDDAGNVIAGVSLAYPRHLNHDVRLNEEQLAPLVREIAAELTHLYVGSQ